jgi:hypothetical protein
MPLYQREKIVIKTCARPLKCSYVVAPGTIFRNTRLDMIRIRCSQIILAVAIDAINSGYIKTQKTLRFVTLNTISGSMRSQQRKATHPVNFINIIYQPGGRSMTTRAIEAYRCLMYIIMAFVTFSFCFREYQRGMTLPAIDHRMLPNQRKFGCVVVKRVNLFI